MGLPRSIDFEYISGLVIVALAVATRLHTVWRFVMRLKVSTAVCLAMLAPSVGWGQSPDRVDPLTGNYVPAADPGAAFDPKAGSNPNRLSNRVSTRNAPNTASPPSTSVPNAIDGLTPAQRMAKRSAYNGQAVQILTPDGTPEQTDQSGFVAMGGMPMYSPPSSTPAPADPFRMPDWWPK